MRQPLPFIYKLFCNLTYFGIYTRGKYFLHSCLKIIRSGIRLPNYRTVNRSKLSVVHTILRELRERPAEDHAGKSTVHITDSPETWHTCTTSLSHYPSATVWFNCILFSQEICQSNCQTIKSVQIYGKNVHHL